jgi:hypothetical protein
MLSLVSCFSLADALNGDWVVSFGSHTGRIVIDEIDDRSSYGYFYLDDNQKKYSMSCYKKNYDNTSYTCAANVSLRKYYFRLKVNGNQFYDSSLDIVTTINESLLISAGILSQSYGLTGSSTEYEVSGFRDYLGAQYFPGIYDFDTRSLHLHSVTYEGNRYDVVLMQNTDSSFQLTSAQYSYQQPSENFDGYKLYAYNVNNSGTSQSWVLQYRDGLFWIYSIENN